VLFEKIQVKKATREQLLTPSARLDSLLDFRAAVRFHDDGTVKFKLQAEQ